MEQSILHHLYHLRFHLSLGFVRIHSLPVAYVHFLAVAAVHFLAVEQQSRGVRVQIRKKCIKDACSMLLDFFCSKVNGFIHLIKTIFYSVIKSIKGKYFSVVFIGMLLHPKTRTLVPPCAASRKNKGTERDTGALAEICQFH